MFIVLGHVPLSQNIFKLRDGLQRSLSILLSSKISDHWKEKVLPYYSRVILFESLRFSAYIILLLLTFLVVFTVLELLFHPDLTSVLERLYRWDVQLVIIVVGSAMMFLRLYKK